MKTYHNANSVHIQYACSVTYSRIQFDILYCKVFENLHNIGVKFSNTLTPLYGYRFEYSYNGNFTLYEYLIHVCELYTDDCVCSSSYINCGFRCGTGTVD